VWLFCPPPGAVLLHAQTWSPRSTYEHTPSRMSLEESLVLGRYRVLLALDERKLVKAYLARDEQGDGSDTPILIKQFSSDRSSRR
jgi:hypothetical protein